MYHYLIVIEKTDNNYSAYSPDLPGCIATGATKEETEENMLLAMRMHIRGLIDDHLPVPPAQAFAELVAIAV